MPHARNRDPFLAQPLELTKKEKADLESFLRSLTDKRFWAIPYLQLPLPKRVIDSYPKSKHRL